MKRTFNYTKRKKINRGDVSLTIVRPNFVPEVKVLKLDINRLRLPITGQVWLEIETGRVGLVRHPLGTVGSLDLNPSYSINERDLGNIRFRIKIVTQEPGSAGKVLAEVDRLSLTEDGNVQSLLEVKPSDDLGQRIWKLEISESGPELLINTGVVDWREVGQSALFQALVFPEAVYEIYKWVAAYEDYDSGSIEEKWKNLFAATGHDPNALNASPSRNADDGEKAEYKEYLDRTAHEVAHAFARNHKALNQFNLGRA